MRKGQTADALLLSIECELKHFNEHTASNPQLESESSRYRS
jgi:hypothetical protein